LLNSLQIIRKHKDGVKYILRKKSIMGYFVPCALVSIYGLLEIPSIYFYLYGKVVQEKYMTMRMEVLRVSETSIIIYQPSWRDTLDDVMLHRHCCAIWHIICSWKCFRNVRKIAYIDEPLHLRGTKSLVVNISIYSSVFQYERKKIWVKKYRKIFRT